MVVIQKKSHLRRALRKELFMLIYGLLIPEPGNGTKYVLFIISSFIILQFLSTRWNSYSFFVVVIRWRKLGCLLAPVQGFRYVSTKSVLCCLVVSWIWKWKVRKWFYPLFVFFLNIWICKVELSSTCVIYLAGDVMMSLFLNELYGFQLDNRRW